MERPVLDNALLEIEKKRTEAKANLSQYIETTRAFEDKLRQATENYVTTRVAYVGGHLKHAWENFLPGVTPKGYFGGIATELGRSLIYAERRGWQKYTGAKWVNGERIELNIPRSKKLTNVAAGLLIIAQEDRQAEHLIRHAHLLSAITDDGVTRCDSARMWHFYFYGAAGKEIFDNFVEQCRTDPVFRIAIGV